MARSSLCCCQARLGPYRSLRAHQARLERTVPVGATELIRPRRLPRARTHPAAQTARPGAREIDDAHPDRLRADLRVSQPDTDDPDAERALLARLGPGGARLPADRPRGRGRGLSRRVRQLVQPAGGARRSAAAVGGHGDPRQGPVGPAGVRCRAARGRGSARRHAGLPAGQPLLRNRQAVGHGLAAVRQRADRLGPGAGDLRLSSTTTSPSATSIRGRPGPPPRPMPSNAASAGTSRIWRWRSAAA